MNLQEWLEYGIEESEILNGFVRCHTDKTHGFYVDVYTDHAEDQDGGKWTSEIDKKYISDILIPLFCHGFDGPVDEFKKIMGIQI